MKGFAFEVTILSFVGAGERIKSGAKECKGAAVASCQPEYVQFLSTTGIIVALDRGNTAKPVGPLRSTGI